MAWLSPTPTTCLWRPEGKRHFFEFSLCLSRACLGKIMHFIYTWRKKCRFLTACIRMLQWGASLHGPTAVPAENASFFSAVPTFVPSLSWEIDRSHIEMAPKRRLEIRTASQQAERTISPVDALDLSAVGFIKRPMLSHVAAITRRDLHCGWISGWGWRRRRRRWR
jgi:hypothetical protein